MKYNRFAAVILASSVSFASTTIYAQSGSFFDEGEVQSTVSHETTASESNDQAQHVQVTEASSQSAGIESLRKAEAFIDPELSAQRAKEIATKKHRLEEAKLTMQELTINEQISALQEKQRSRDLQTVLEQRQKEWEKEKADLIEDYEEKIHDLKYQMGTILKQQEERQEVDNVLKNKIFVTKVFGIGHNLKARIYYDNNIVTRQVGEEIIPGAVIKQIDSSGVLVNYKGNEQFIAITTTAHAHRKTFVENQRMGSSISLPPEFGSIQ